jgi:hypothetical protein
LQRNGKKQYERGQRTCFGHFYIAGYAQHAYIIHQNAKYLHRCETVQKKSLFYYDVSKTFTNAFTFFPD